jgi:hypothetical protein
MTIGSKDIYDWITLPGLKARLKTYFTNLNFTDREGRAEQKDKDTPTPTVLIFTQRRNFSERWYRCSGHIMQSKT